MWLSTACPFLPLRFFYFYFYFLQSWTKFVQTYLPISQLPMQLTASVHWAVFPSVFLLTRYLCNKLMLAYTYIGSENWILVN